MRPTLCDSSSALGKAGSFVDTYVQEAKTPIITQSGLINPRAVRQISMGSILGVLGGLGVSVFSKPLAILLGLGVIVVQVSWHVYLSIQFKLLSGRGRVWGS